MDGIAKTIVRILYELNSVRLKYFSAYILEMPFGAQNNDIALKGVRHVLATHVHVNALMSSCI